MSKLHSREDIRRITEIHSNDIAAMLKSRDRRPRILLAGSVMPHIPESRIYHDLLKKMVVDLDVSFHSVLNMLVFLRPTTNPQKSLSVRSIIK